MHEIVGLAKNTINLYVKEKKVFAAPDPLSEEMKGRAGVFVSIKKHHQLRGCIGTFAPTTKNIAEEVIRNAIQAAIADPRFSPITLDELKDLEISVDILSAPKPVKDKKYLDAKKYGVIVKSGMRRGLLLPDLEGVDTPDEQIEICRQKAGIGTDDPIELFQFEVRRYK